MKIVMINDCASAGETLLKYMPTSIEKQHIKRSRSLWSKTFGVACKILKAHGDVYQANYLLQDCYIAARLGKKPLIGYAVGSDLRIYLKHQMWGRIVRHNLKNCDKIMVSTPDLISMAQPFRKDVEYLTPPVDPELFYPKPLTPRTGKRKLLIASNANWHKGTDIAVRALSRLKEEADVSIIAQGSDFSKTLELASSLGLNFNILPKVPHERINEYYWNADLIIDQFKVGCPGTVAIEAIACGRPAVTYVSSTFPEYGEFQPKDVDSEDKIVEAVREALASDGILKKQQEYLNMNHKVDAVLKKLMSIYDSVTKS
jgi:glycosyltransferase involved in cell wall biosynthesis